VHWLLSCRNKAGDKAPAVKETVLVSGGADRYRVSKSSMLSESNAHELSQIAELAW
jgi:hypothetical protein